MTDTIKKKADLKAYFQTGCVPTQSQFDDLITSVVTQGGNPSNPYFPFSGAVNIGALAFANGNAGSFAHGGMSMMVDYCVISNGNGGSFAQGIYAVSGGNCGSFAQGFGAFAIGNYGSFSQGKNTNACGASGSFAQGCNSRATGNYGSFAQGSDSCSYGCNGSFAQGKCAQALGYEGSFAQGLNVQATGCRGSFAQGIYTCSTGSCGSFAQGNSVAATGSVGSFAQGAFSTASGTAGSFAQGNSATSSGSCGSFAQGYNACSTGGYGSFASGRCAISLGNLGSFAMGANVCAVCDSSWAVGLDVTASNVGQVSRGIGRFVFQGDAQYSDFILKVQTSTDTQTIMTPTITIPVSKTWAFTLLISARQENGNSAGYSFYGVIKTVSNTVSIVGSVAKTVIAEDVAGWDADVTVNDTQDTLEVLVTGTAATTINWVGQLRVAEVGLLEA